MFLTSLSESEVIHPLLSSRRLPSHKPCAPSPWCRGACILSLHDIYTHIACTWITAPTTRTFDVPLASTLDITHKPSSTDWPVVMSSSKIHPATSPLLSSHLSKTDKDGKAMPLVRLPQIIDLCSTIGRTLKRLALDFQPVYAVASEIELMRPHISENNIFLHMPQLEELIASYDVLDYFSSPPPNLRRLAVTFQDLKDTQIDFCFATSSLETLFFLRSPELVAADIDLIFSAYKGKSLDVVLVDVNSNHQTPEGTRSWSDDDIVRI
jgi:hypothetical protein